MRRRSAKSAETSEKPTADVVPEPATCPVERASGARPTKGTMKTIQT